MYKKNMLMVNRLDVYYVEIDRPRCFASRHVSLC